MKKCNRNEMMRKLKRTKEKCSGWGLIGLVAGHTAVCNAIAMPTGHIPL